jgi:Di-haem oxidoreductase, putative peroxidase
MRRSALFAALCASVLGVEAQPVRPEIPKAWDERALSSLEVPLANPRFSPQAVSANYYYSVPVRPVYKTYPVYAPGREPAGYFEWLQTREPHIAFDSESLHSELDWIQAGELVFHAPFGFDFVFSVADVRNQAWYDHVRPPLTKDGVMPFASYVVREKGKVELGTFACSMCHTRVMPDGSVIEGAQGNFNIDRANGFGLRRLPPDVVRQIYRTLAGAPWLEPDPGDFAAFSSEKIASIHDSMPSGVVVRHRSSAYHPTAIPDLVGIADRRYLDRTGLVQHRDIGDLMRYAALNNEMDFLSRFGDFIPRGKDYRTLPDPSTQLRYSDEQLYALAKYLYALKPPSNPNRLEGLAQQGRQVFDAQGCGQCHTPPLYTNNKLVPVRGFAVPAEHRKKYNISPIVVGTDSGLTLQTRRGTGYYKVPSLRGVWYRGPFEHSGSVMTLEDWFDPKRLQPNYVPTGFAGLGMKTRAVPGHEYGLGLSPEEKKTLIAFLRTL